MNNKKINVQDIIIAALLTALSLVIPQVFPKIPLGQFFTITFASHVPGIIAMFVSPFAVVGTAVGGALGFLMGTGSVLVAVRALSHIVFSFMGYAMLKRKSNVFIVIVLTGIVHALCEVVVVTVNFILFGFPEDALVYLASSVALLTFIHHCIDFAISFVVVFALKSARFLKTDINFKSLKG